MGDGAPISADEVEQVEERQRPRSAVIFETIRREGEDSYERSSASLFWSAVAAGGSMTFSMITMGVLVAHMPDTPWRHLVASFGSTTLRAPRRRIRSGCCSPRRSSPAG
ncbi:MAG TPA: hypothetical protein VN224_00580 [Xanthomonadales bacterium]|nr:hypothetical protein [Xanthomonadales bacterium]